MPHVDFGSLVLGSVSADGKVVCETTLRDPSLDADLPAESFRVPIEDELDWVHQNAAAFYDRDNSTKGITNPKSHHGNANPVASSSSQRFSGSLKPKAPIIGLPNKVRVQLNGRRARKTGRFSGLLIIPTEKGGTGGGARQGNPSGAGVPWVEPGSPKVSCLGKVLSEHERDRYRQAIRGMTKGRSRSAAEEGRGGGGEGRGGFWGGLVRRFASWKGTRTGNFADEEAASYRTSTATGRGGSFNAAAPLSPGLGGMRTFSSGRRAASREEEEEIEVDAGSSGPLTGIRGRRAMGELDGLDCARDLEEVGSASL